VPLFIVALAIPQAMHIVPGAIFAMAASYTELIAKASRL